MEQIPSPTVLDLILSPLFLLPIFFIILINHAITVFFHRRSLPPGPTPWPVIGNVLQLQPKKLHISLANFAQIHGPLISLRLGSQVVIVASSPSAAAEILKNHDRSLCGRFIRKAVPRRSDELERIAIVWNPNCSDHWKFARSLSRSELFSAKAIESQAKLREKKLKEMMEFLKSKEGTAVNIGEIVFATVFNTISNLVFSKDLIDFESGGKAKSTVWKLMEVSSGPNVAEFYPWLEGLDLQGLKKKMSNCLEELFGVWEIYIKERRESRRKGDFDQSGDFLDVFLDNGFDDDRINWLVMEFFAAASDTTTTTIEWAMTELLKNEHVVKTLIEELDREINNKTINESLASQLPYLNACIKETLRLHPPAPLLVHSALETCEIMNRTIPKDVQVLVNVWAIGRDGSTWKDPLSFEPKRFLGTTIDFKGHDFGLIPFGSGRRVCPGLPMAARQLPLILAYLIHYFHWSLPNGEDLKTLSTAEKFGITLQREKPLLLIPQSKFK